MLVWIMRWSTMSLAFSLALGGCKKTEPESAPPAPAEKVTSAAKDTKRPAVDESEMAVRINHVQAAVKMIEGGGAVPMKKKPPLEEWAARLVRAGAYEVGYLIAPDGMRFGLGARGGGETFGRAVAERIGAMLDPNVRKQVLTLARYNDWKGIYFEILFGQPMWLRAGVEGVSETKVRVALEEMKVPAAEIERLLAPAAGDGKVEAIGMVADPARGASVGVSVRAAGSAEGIEADKDALGDTVPVVERVADWKDETFVRRPGLINLDLIDWQTRQGFSAEAARRMGAVHASLDLDGPAVISWQAGLLHDTVVYHYTEKTAGMAAAIEASDAAGIPEPDPENLPPWSDNAKVAGALVGVYNSAMMQSKPFQVEDDLLGKTWTLKLKGGHADEVRPTGPVTGQFFADFRADSGEKVIVDVQVIWDPRKELYDGSHGMFRAGELTVHRVGDKPPRYTYKKKGKYWKRED